MDPKVQQQLDELEVKIAEIHTFTKKIERYMRLTFWVTIVLIVLPILLGGFLLSSVMGSLSSLPMQDIMNAYTI